MQNASLNESEQAAIFIGITRATREIDALHNALSAIADVPNDGSYASNVRLSKLASQRDQADAKLRAAIIKHTIIRTHSGG